MGRKLLIAWKWDIFEANTDLVNCVHVHSTEQRDTVIQFNERVEAQQLINWLMSADQQSAEADEWLILLHEGKSSHWGLEARRTLSETLNLRNQPQIHTFGGGKLFIYFDAITNTGIIDQTGDFYNQKIKHPVDGTDWEPDILIGDGEINPFYFNPVWEDYFHDLKKKLYKLRNDLLRFIYYSEPDTSLSQDHLEQIQVVVNIFKTLGIYAYQEQLFNNLTSRVISQESVTADEINEVFDSIYQAFYGKINTMV
jgi:hypothetical protein